MVAVEEAIEAILRHTRVLPTEEVDSLDARGRTLAEDVAAVEPLPAGPRSAVDGYAVRSVDAGDRALIDHEIAAGPQAAIQVQAGQAVRIMTGAPVPDGADAVVMVEDTEERADVVSIHRAPKAGEHVHREGQDIHAGQAVVSAGCVLGPAEIGLLATIGRVRVKTYARPKVAILATGDELVEPWESPPPGCIRDSNRYALRAAAQEAGAEVVWQGVARDEEDHLATQFQTALAGADVVLTSGGVSMGTRDLIKPLLDEFGKIHFGRVNFKPGKPLTFATIGDKLVFGLPGYPVSSLVTLEVFVRPSLVKMQGRTEVFRPRVEVELEAELTPDPVRPEYQRAIVAWSGGRLLARTTGGQGSSRLMSMLGANALLEIRPADHPVPAGQRVPALLTGPIATALS
jgi:molybdenum cofactor synthesis domain-containing protein